MLQRLGVSRILNEVQIVLRTNMSHLKLSTLGFGYLVPLPKIFVALLLLIVGTRSGHGTPC